jgi:hypothetical protein
MEPPNTPILFKTYIILPSMPRITQQQQKLNSSKEYTTASNTNSVTQHRLLEQSKHGKQSESRGCV